MRHRNRRNEHDQNHCAAAARGRDFRLGHASEWPLTPQPSIDRLAFEGGAFPQSAVAFGLWGDYLLNRAINS